MSHSTQALGSLPGLGLLGLIAASGAAKADVLKVLPHMSCCVQHVLLLLETLHGCGF